jgi:(p)ppGpp synthase/HD superfamily hydrolase
MQQWIMVLRAADCAARWHVHQRRKGTAKEPYISHLPEVASLVSEATEGSDPELVIAALPHDAIEDQEVPKAFIEEAFGRSVLHLVLEVTDDKMLPKEERKQRQIDHAPHLTKTAKILKLADKTSNIRGIADSPPEDWSVSRRLEYIDWAREVVAGLRGANSWLEEEFDEAARRAEVSIQP